jgi:hypothetical protein
LLLLLLTPLLLLLLLLTLLLLLHCAVQQARIRAAGGQVFYHNGCRVMGVLAMTRAIGDHALRPYGDLADGLVCCCCTLLLYHAADYIPGIVQQLHVSKHFARTAAD